MRTRRTTVLLTLFWLAAGSIYVWAALQQKERVNLSPTAGGQYAYLRYSQGVAEEGVTRHFGDRNRMPLYPALLALTYHEDWDTFVDRSAWFAIVSSLAVLAGVGLLAYRVLPIWPATAFTLMAGVTVFIHKASFVQAELLYYGLLLASWLLLCRVIRRPDPAWAAGAGVVLALTYLTKASALATLVAFVTIQIIYAVVLALRKGTPQVDTPPQPSRAGARRALVAAVIVSAVFLAVVYPYISNSKSRFGRYFYNVNSRFFMWCDSWAQAKAFANRYDVSARYPAAPPEDVPGPVNYWRTHSLTQILRRLGHGFRTLGSLALAGKYLKYLLVIAAFCVLLGVGRRHRLREVRPENWGVVAFSFLLFGGYGIAYAWYAQIAYGDRFVLSLVLPLTLALWWLGHHLALSTRALRIFGRRMYRSDGLAIGLAVVLIGEGTWTTTRGLYHPDDAFIHFYFNESHHLLETGDLGEAAKGFEGVVKLDPSFAPAHRDLGMIALISGRFEDAIASLGEAARLRPLDADIRNSLGSALLQAGRVGEAYSEFHQATRLDPAFATAWYNLAVACHQRGARDEAKAALERLEELDPVLARKLRAIMSP